jgi:uncharacterized membrane protein HdeD (DUF308 family)
MPTLDGHEGKIAVKNKSMGLKIFGVFLILFGIVYAVFPILSTPTETAFPKVARYSPIVSGILNIILGGILVRRKPTENVEK